MVRFFFSCVLYTYKCTNICFEVCDLSALTTGGNVEIGEIYDNCRLTTSLLYEYQVAARVAEVEHEVMSRHARHSVGCS